MGSKVIMAIKLLTTNTSSNAASSSFTSDIDNTYNLYIFKFFDVNPATDGAVFEFQANAAGASGYNETMVTTFFNAKHNEDDTSTVFGYSTCTDQAQGTAFQDLSYGIGNGADECLAGELHLFDPSSTTYVKHYYSRIIYYDEDNIAYDVLTAGYFNTTTAIDDIQFKMTSGNMDSIIKMYGVG